MKQILTKLKNSGRKSKSSTPDPTVVPGNLVLSPAPTNFKVKPLSDGPQCNAPLENLPPGIRSQLLSILALEELSSLVHASPVFHQQYLLDRRRLLCECLEVTLRTVTVDACASYRTSLATFSDTRSKETVTQFLKFYEGRRSSTRYSIHTEMLTEDEAVGMAAFHFAIIKPLAQHYKGWALASLAVEIQFSQGHESYSRTEETRVLRALYRFQLCCNAFGAAKPVPLQLKLGFQAVDILKIFLCLYEPWEVEEIACIYAFSKEKYDQIFENIRWDVHEENPKFDGQRPPTPEGAFDLDNSWTRSSLMKGTISRGLELLHTVFFTIRDHEHLVSVMQKHIQWPVGNFLEHEALGDTAQLQRRREQPSDRDLKQQRRDPLPFRGDIDPETNTSESHPPLAWTLIWHGTYSNLFGYHVSDVIRRWGYVMWDAARLKYMGAQEVLMQQCEADWWENDPRDEVW